MRRSDGSPVETLSLRPNEPIPIDGYGTVRGVNYDQNFQGNGPALQVVVEKPGKPAANFWLLQQLDDKDFQRNDGLVFSFGGLDSKMFTGLQVAKDPGVNVVWLGCALMVVGITMAFFLSHQRVWVRLAQGHGRPRGGRPRGLREPEPACLREEIRETTDRREGGGTMSNVILFNLTTVLFGVASALYLGALYAKNERIAVFGTWVCILAAVVSTAALGVRWYESYQMGIGRIPVTNLYESLVFFAWSVNLFYLVVERKYAQPDLRGVRDADRLLHDGLRCL